MRWFEETRIQWIEETVQIFGFINRQHIMSKFGISKPQASHDMNEFMRRYPGLIEYDKRTRRYRKVASGRSKPAPARARSVDRPRFLRAPPDAAGPGEGSQVLRASATKGPVAGRKGT